MMRKTILSLVLFILLQHVVQAQSDLWSRSGNSLAGTEKFGSTNSKPVNFFTNNTQRMTLAAGGQLGIGTKTPKSMLHVFRGAGADASLLNPNLTMITESANDNFIGVFAPFSKESGIEFGERSDEAGI